MRPPVGSTGSPEVVAAGRARAEYAAEGLTHSVFGVAMAPETPCVGSHLRGRVERNLQARNRARARACFGNKPSRRTLGQAHQLKQKLDVQHRCSPMATQAWIRRCWAAAGDKGCCIHSCTGSPMSSSVKPGTPAQPTCAALTQEYAGHWGAHSQKQPNRGFYG